MKIEEIEKNRLLQLKEKILHTNEHLLRQDHEIIVELIDCEINNNK